MKELWKYFLAWTRFSEKAVCEMSNRGHGMDFHDYPDAENFESSDSPMHFHIYKCKRCGKEFGI